MFGPTILTNEGTINCTYLMPSLKPWTFYLPGQAHEQSFCDLIYLVSIFVWKINPVMVLYGGTYPCCITDGKSPLITPMYRNPRSATWYYKTKTNVLKSMLRKLVIISLIFLRFTINTMFIMVNSLYILYSHKHRGLYENIL